MSPLEALLVAAGVITALTVIVTGAWKVGRAIVNTIKGITEFLDDWRGEPARPGHDATPGVLTRLKGIEKQLHPNHGTSMADQLDRLEQTAEYAVALGHSNHTALEELREHLGMDPREFPLPQRERQ